jgi:hypothetical protein
MSGSRWKRQEREIADLVGSHRNPNTGEHRSDIDTPAFAYEVKTRKELPGWLKAAVQQACRAAQDGQTGVVVLSEVSQGKKAERYAVLRLSDWLQWHHDTPVLEG